MTAMVGLNIVIAVALGLMGVVCAIASLCLRRNVALGWLAAALASGTAQTLFLTFASGTVLEFVSAMIMAPLGFLLANLTINALMPAQILRRPFLITFAGLCGGALLLYAADAPFFFQVMLVQLACALAMVESTARILRNLRWRLLDISLLAVVCLVAVLRMARLPLLIWHFGPEVAFADYNQSSIELSLLAAESLLTIGIIGLIIAAIVADTIAMFRHQSERDGLTGLLNRRALDTVASAATAKGGAVVFCDIDHFKLVNDRFGHQAGDDVICTFAQILQRTGYPAARIGGEEFAIVLPDRSLQDGLDLAEMIRARFAAVPHIGLPQAERVTASFGVAACVGGQPLNSSFSQADAALYAAKNAGRNRVERYSQSLATDQAQRRRAA